MKGGLTEICQGFPGMVGDSVSTVVESGPCISVRAGQGSRIFLHAYLALSACTFCAGFQRLRVAYVNKERAAQQEENQLLLQIDRRREEAIADKVKQRDAPHPGDRKLRHAPVPFLADRNIVLGGLVPWNRALRACMRRVGIRQRSWEGGT